MAIRSLMQKTRSPSEPTTFRHPTSYPGATVSSATPSYGLPVASRAVGSAGKLPARERDIFATGPTQFERRAALHSAGDRAHSLPLDGQRATASRPRNSLFSKMDTNADGVLSRQEVQRAVRTGVIRSPSVPVGGSVAQHRDREQSLDDERNRVNELKGAAHLAMQALRPQSNAVGPAARGARMPALALGPPRNEAALLRALPRMEEKEDLKKVFKAMGHREEDFNTLMAAFYNASYEERVKLMREYQEWVSVADVREKHLQKAEDFAHEQKRIEDRRRKVAATTIQAWWRGTLVRREAARRRAKKEEEKRKRIASRLQEQEKNLRAHRDKNEKLRKAGIDKRTKEQVVTYLDGLAKKKKVDEDRAARLIQGMYHAWVARKEFKRFMDGERLEKENRKQQQAERKRRKELDEKKKKELEKKKEIVDQKAVVLRKVKEFEAKRREAAAKKIQSLYRGRKARAQYKKMQSIVQKQKVEEKKRRLKMKEEETKKLEAKEKREKALQRKTHEEEKKVWVANNAARKIQAARRRQVAQREVNASKAKTKARKEQELAAKQRLAKETKKREEAARKIQAVFRGRHARHAFEEKKQAIKTAAEKKVAEADRLKKEKAQKKVEDEKNAQRQAAELAKKDAQERRKIAAATKIQKVFRAKKDRMFVAQKKQLMAEQAEMKKLKKQEEEQERRRLSLERRQRETRDVKEKERIVKERMRLELEQKKLNDAATKVQRSWRGRAERRKVKGIREALEAKKMEKRRLAAEASLKKAEEEKAKKKKVAAGKKLLAAYRGRLVRREYLKKRNADKDLENKEKEARIKSREDETRFAKERKKRYDAAVKIQNKWRMRSERNNFLNLLREKAERVKEIRSLEQAHREGVMKVFEAQQRKAEEEAVQRRREEARLRIEERKRKEEHAAATKIQAMRRAQVNRREFLEGRQAKQEAEAAAKEARRVEKIAAEERERKAREKMQRIQEEENRLEEEERIRQMQDARIKRQDEVAEEEAAKVERKQRRERLRLEKLAAEEEEKSAKRVQAQLEAEELDKRFEEAKLQRQHENDAANEQKEAKRNEKRQQEQAKRELEEKLAAAEKARADEIQKEKNNEMKRKAREYDKQRLDLAASKIQATRRAQLERRKFRAGVKEKQEQADAAKRARIDAKAAAEKAEREESERRQRELDEEIRIRNERDKEEALERLQKKREELAALEAEKAEVKRTKKEQEELANKKAELELAQAKVREQEEIERRFEKAKERRRQEREEEERMKQAKREAREAEIQAQREAEEEAAAKERAAAEVERKKQKAAEREGFKALEQRRLDNAATKIQARWRGKETRRIIGAIQQQRKDQIDAEKAYRLQLKKEEEEARKYEQKVAEEARLQDLEQQRQERIAAAEAQKIADKQEKEAFKQAVWADKEERRAAAAEVERIRRLAAENQAATKIQTMVRGRLARKRVERQKVWKERERQAKREYMARKKTRGEELEAEKPMPAALARRLQLEQEAYLSGRKEERRDLDDLEEHFRQKDLQEARNRLKDVTDLNADMDETIEMSKATIARREAELKEAEAKGIKQIMSDADRETQRLKVLAKYERDKAETRRQKDDEIDRKNMKRFQSRSQSPQDSRFDAYDTNKDGVISRAEFHKAMTASPSRHIEAGQKSPSRAVEDERRRQEDAILRVQIDAVDYSGDYVQALRLEERGVRHQRLRDDADLRLRRFVAQDKEVEEASRKQREQAARERLLQGGTEAERQEALRVLHDLEEERFDDREVLRLRVMQLEQRQQDMEIRHRLDVETLRNEAATKIQSWYRGESTRKSIADRITAEAEAKRLEGMLAMEMEKRLIVEMQQKVDQERAQRKEEGKANQIRHKMMEREGRLGRERTERSEWQDSLRSPSPTLPGVADGTLERRRLQWDVERAKRRKEHLITMEEVQRLELDAMASQERCKITEMSVALGKKKEDVFEQRKLVSQWTEEVSRLRLLHALSSDMQRCYRCDLNLANLQPLLRGLQQVISALHTSIEDPRNRDDQDILQILGAVLRDTSHIDPQIAELASYLPKNLQDTVATMSPRSQLNSPRNSPFTERFNFGGSASQAESPSPSTIYATPTQGNSPNFGWDGKVSPGVRLSPAQGSPKQSTTKAPGAKASLALRTSPSQASPKQPNPMSITRGGRGSPPTSPDQTGASQPKKSLAKAKAARVPDYISLPTNSKAPSKSFAKNL